MPLRNTRDHPFPVNLEPGEAVLTAAEYAALWPTKEPDADGLYRYEVPESDEEELTRLRAENQRLRDLLVNERLLDYPMSGMMSDAQYEATREQLVKELDAELEAPTPSATPPRTAPG